MKYFHMVIDEADVHDRFYRYDVDCSNDDECVWCFMGLVKGGDGQQVPTRTIYEGDYADARKRMEKQRAPRS